MTKIKSEINEIDDEIDSRKRDLEVITDPTDYQETVDEINDMEEDKKKLMEKEN